MNTDNKHTSDTTVNLSFEVQMGNLTDAIRYWTEAIQTNRASAMTPEQIHELVFENNMLKDQVHNLTLYLDDALAALNGYRCFHCNHRANLNLNGPCGLCGDRIFAFSNGFEWNGKEKFSGLPGYIPHNHPAQ